MSEHFRHPIAWADLVDYWAGDVGDDAQATLEEHLMGCEVCSHLSERVAAITESLRGLIPPLLTVEALTNLAARGLRIVENPMRPGERREVTFPAEADILLHRLGGLELADATHVRFVLRVEGTDEVLVAIEDAPFDRSHGSVLVACQKRFLGMPPDTVAEVRVRNAAGVERVVTYTILHRYGDAVAGS